MKLVFVLVEPKVPENVGAAARALKTMGFGDLWVVNSDAHRQDAALWVAHGSDDILANIREFGQLKDVHAAADLLVGTTAKPRHGLVDWHTPQSLGKALVSKGQSVATAALVFGREDRGLSNEELAQCHLLSGFPLAVSYPSLNLAQAVMLYAWELSGLKLPATTMAGREGPASWRVLHERIMSLLPAIGAAEDQKLKTWLHERLGRLEERDVNFLHTLTGDIEKFLQKAKK